MNNLAPDFILLVIILCGFLALLYGYITRRQIMNSATGNKIMKSLVELFEAAKIPAKVTGVGALFDIYFTDEEIIDYRSTLTANKSKMVDFNKKLLQNGVLKGNSKFYISSAHENDDIRDTIKALEETIESIKSN